MIVTIPIPPKPQSRPRFSSRGGFVKAYEEKEMTAYKLRVSGWFRKTGSKPIENAPVSITLRFYVAPPKYLAKKKRQQALENETIWVDKKPDLDNYVKAILDAINGIAYKDDGQIASLNAVKVYSYNPRTEIEITKMEMNRCIKP